MLLLPYLQAIISLTDRILYCLIYCPSQEVIKSLVESIPREMVAARLSIGISINLWYSSFRFISTDTRAISLDFTTSPFLHLQSCNAPPKLDHDSKAEMAKSLCFIAATVPSLDFFSFGLQAVYHRKV
jgi:hypothetical protein